MKTFILITFLFFLSCSNNSANSQQEEVVEEEVKLTETIQYRSIEGIDESLLSLDIYHTDNSSANRPVIIWVHGGGWSIGDKANKIEDKAELFQKNGWVFISVNYRLSPFPYELSNPNRIMYPVHNKDLAFAIKWVYDNIIQYGGNPSKMALLGHSAGAHLVALTGTRTEFLEHVDVPLSAIKGIAAIDTEGYDVRSKVEESNELYINAFGDIESENIEASPLFNITSGILYPKFFIAKRGSPSRIAIANRFISSLEEQNVSVDQIEASVYSHSEINDAIGKESETLVTKPLIAFLNHVLSN